MKIICPVCKEKLNKDDKRMYCVNNHSFDVSKEGYINLSQKSSVKTGDEKQMVKARTSFLNKEYYSFLRKSVNEIINVLHVKSLLDLGCGEGYYTSYFNVPNKVGIDLSKEALKYASKKDKSTTYILKTIFDVPIEDKSVDCVLTIFAPISTEINRVLKDNGYFILVKPNKKHLIELKEAVYDDPYLNEVEDIKIDGLKLINEYKIKNKDTLNNEDLKNLFTMTPYYHKTSINDINKLNDIDILNVTFSFIIDVYQKVN